MHVHMARFIIEAKYQTKTGDENESLEETKFQERKRFHIGCFVISIHEEVKEPNGSSRKVFIVLSSIKAVKTCSYS